MVGEGGAGKDRGTGGIRQRQFRTDEGIVHRHVAFIRKIYAVVDADIASAHRGQPVPADGCVHGGIIGPQDTAILLGRIGILELGLSIVGIHHNQDSQIIGSPLQDTAYVETGRIESALYTADILSIEPDTGLEIDSVKVQELAGCIGMRLKTVSVPEITLEIGIRNNELVIGKIGVGNSSGIDIRTQDSTRYGGYHPGGIVVSGRRENFPQMLPAFHFRCPDQLPVSSGQFLLPVFACGRFGRPYLNGTTSPDFPFFQFKRFTVGAGIQHRLHISAFH